MRSRRLSRLLAGLLAVGASGQTGPMLTVGTMKPLVVRKSAPVVIDVPVQVAAGFHVNSDKPNDEYLIPLKLTWDRDLLQVSGMAYPAPTTEKYQFSEQPLSVLTGGFTIKTRGTLLPAAKPGPGLLTGRLRYQACSERACFPPKTVPVSVSVEIR